MSEELEKIESEKSSERFSFSKLSTFEDCPYCFYLQYRLTDEDRDLCGYIPEGNYYAENGSLVHSVLERYFNGEIELDDLPGVYIDEYDGVCYKVRESTMKKTFETCADYFAEVDFDWMKDWEVVGVELKVEIEIRGYKYIGFIDLLLKNKETGEYWIIDHKSSDYPFKRDGTVSAKSKESFASYKKQMYLYCYAIKKLYGKYPTKISWNHFKAKKFATIDFEQKECTNAVNWFVRTIKKIQNEKQFEPKKDFFHCSELCDYRNCCEYRKEDL